MVSVIGWQTLFPIKSLLVIPCADNTEKEMVFSARVTAKCPCIWRSIVRNETEPGCLSAGLLPSSAPQRGKDCEDGPQISSKFNSMNKKVQNVRHVSHAVY